MKTQSGLLPWVVNGVCMVAACFVVYRFLVPPAEETPRPSSPSAPVAAATGVDWSAQPRTLVMAISPGCRWCTASAPFYRELVNAKAEKTFHIVVASFGYSSGD